MPDKWKSLVDRLLQDAQEAGKFDNLPNAGKPLQFEDETHIPEELRMAHRLLKEHDLAPDWIMLGREIDLVREKLLGRMTKTVESYCVRLDDGVFEQRQEAETRLRQARAGYAKEAVKLNRDIRRYNLKVPPGFPQKALFDPDRELERLLGRER